MVGTREKLGVVHESGHEWFWGPWRMISCVKSVFFSVGVIEGVGVRVGFAGLGESWCAPSLSAVLPGRRGACRLGTRCGRDGSGRRRGLRL